MDPIWQPTTPEPGDDYEARSGEPNVPDLGRSPELNRSTAAQSGAAAPLIAVAKSSRATARGTILGMLLLGGIAGAVIIGPLSALAASPAPTAGSTSAAPVTGTDTDVDTDHGGPGGGPGGHVEAVTDTSVVAKAIGISEADLKTALAGGQTVAQVAKAHNVALQTVIDGLVADSTSELAADVASGKITQPQADAQKAAILQRATDQANGSFSGGRP